MALSTVFHSVNSPHNSPLSHPVLLVLFSLIDSFNYISLYESLPQPWYNPLWLSGLKAPTNYLTNYRCVFVYVIGSFYASADDSFFKLNLSYFCLRRSSSLFSRAPFLLLRKFRVEDFSYPSGARPALQKKKKKRRRGRTFPHNSCITVVKRTYKPLKLDRKRPNCLEDEQPTLLLRR